MEPQITYQTSSKSLIVRLSGDFQSYDAAEKTELLPELTPDTSVSFEAAELGRWDSTLVVVLFQLALLFERRQFAVDWSGLPPNLHELLRLALTKNVKPPLEPETKTDFLEALGGWGINTGGRIKKGFRFCREVLSSFGRLLAGRAVMRRVDFLFALEAGSYKACGIVAVVSFMVGLILAYVGSIQLQNFGAQIYVASLVAIGMTRIMGAIMAGIVMAGRTGASYAATIGTMQVNEEIDALKTMGVPTTDFLVLPRLAALIVTLPFLTLLSDVMGIIGGAVVGVLTLGIPWQEYWKYTYNALTLNNFWLGIFHGFVYGWIISLCGCYYGIYSGRNADSVGVATTNAVVSSIVWMIVVTGFLTVFFQEVNI